MVFSSLLFLFRFLPAVLILYYIAPRKLRNVILLLFSLFFYAWGEPKYVFLMLFTITMDFFIGKGIDKAKKEGNQKKAKRFLMTSILVDLSILGFFKYADFLIGTVNTLTGAGIPLLGIPLPIGISFFTFQTMSYTIDVYKGNTEVQKNWIKYGTYVSMFPQLIAGPIVQYKTIARADGAQKGKYFRFFRRYSSFYDRTWQKSPDREQHRCTLGCHCSTSGRWTGSRYGMAWGTGLYVPDLL